MLANSWANKMRNKAVARGKGIDNHPEGAAAKIAIRRWLLDAIGAERAQVLDLFAGSGVMFRSVWNRAAGYTGCDKNFFRDSRRAYVVDNMRLLRAIELGRFNVFDLDAYGAPWPAATVIAARRRLAEGETVALALTDGSMMRAKLGGPERAMADLAGVRPSLRGTHRNWTAFTRAALQELAGRMGGELVELRTSEHAQRAMFYCGAMVRYRPADEKKAPAAEAAGAG